MKNKEDSCIVFDVTKYNKDVLEAVYGDIEVELQKRKTAKLITKKITKEMKLKAIREMVSNKIDGEAINWKEFKENLDYLISLDTVTGRQISDKETISILAEELEPVC